VKIKVPVKLGQSIRPVGSDISYVIAFSCFTFDFLLSSYYSYYSHLSFLRLGQLVASAGDRISPTEIGLLSSLGLVRVTVYPPPVVAILSTGNELVEPHEKPLPGYVREILLCGVSSSHG
jgi:hypothetical protein